MIAPKPARTKKKETPSEFFNRQLAGEIPLSFAGAKRLFELATALAVVRPWQFLEDQDLVLLKSPLYDETCYCSVMGALGEVFSLHAYVGDESYRYFKKIAEEEPISIGEFYGSLRGAYVEFVSLSELTPPDRELARAFGHPLKTGLRAPMFRALRPGYQPWYVTEDEGLVLAECIQAVLAFCERIIKGDATDYWKEKDNYPFVRPIRADQGNRYELEMVKVSLPLPAALEPARLDQDRIRRVREQNYPLRGVFEVDHFYGGGLIGQKDERKACARVALVADANTGLVFPPELGMPERTTSDMLATAIIGAVEAARFLPREIRATQLQFEAALEPLGREMGFAVRTVKRLPALQEAKEGLLTMMGDPGTFIP